MTESIASQPACWASLDHCLHQHHSVIAGDLRLQAAHAAFQLQLATLRVLRPNSEPDPKPSATRAGETSLREYLEFLLQEIFTNILTPAAMPDASPESAPPIKSLDHLALLERAENTVRHLRDNPALWTRCGLAALQVRALADLQNAYALETGILAPSGDPENRSQAATEEIIRLIRQELDPLVRTHETGAPKFVADYRTATRQPASEEADPRSRTRGRLSFRFGKKTELSLSN